MSTMTATQPETTERGLLTGYAVGAAFDEMVDASLAIVNAAQAGNRQELAPVVVSARLIERGTTRMPRSG